MDRQNGGVYLFGATGLLGHDAATRFRRDCCVFGTFRFLGYGWSSWKLHFIDVM